MGICSFLGDLVERFIIFLAQLVEAAPARIFRWHRIVLQPAAIGVKIKIILRFNRLYPCSSDRAAGDSGWLARRFEPAGLPILFEPAN